MCGYFSYVGFRFHCSPNPNFINDDDRMELAVFAVRQLSNAWKVTPSDAIALLRQSAWMDRNLS
ncbi:TPA: hypothetical protein F6T30_05745 [Escherichia coli]|nr:hypothetical protein [Escherichia coli]